MRPNWENECVNKSALIEWLRPYMHTGEPIPADVLISDIQMMPTTLTPPNECVSRLTELDELYTKVRIVTGFTVEQLLEMFTAGYTLEKPDYSKASEEMASLPETTPPNNPLTLDELRQMDGEPVWVEEVEHWALIDIEKGGQWDGVPFAIWAENGARFTYNIKDRGLHCYRRPPEREEGSK